MQKKFTSEKMSSELSGRVENVRKMLHLPRNERILVAGERPTDWSVRDYTGFRLGCTEKEHGK